MTCKASLMKDLEHLFVSYPRARQQEMATTTRGLGCVRDGCVQIAAAGLNVDIMNNG